MLLNKIDSMPKPSFDRKDLELFRFLNEKTKLFLLKEKSSGEMKNEKFFK
jgi:hypothetical protein